MEIKQKETKEARRNMKKVALHRRGRCAVTVLNFQPFVLFIQQTVSSCQNSEWSHYFMLSLLHSTAESK